MAKKFSKPELSRVINGDLPNPKANNAPEPELVRLDLALLEHYAEYSRATLQKFIKSGFVTVDGSTATKPNTLIEPTATLELLLPEQTVTKRPETIYEDEHVIVFNKPIGMLSIKKGEYSDEPCIADYGEIVHRLDRDTSGVIIVAKDADTKAYLQRQFQARKTHKTYYAVTVGHPQQPHAIINIPLARNLKRPTTFIVSPDGREAITEYEVIVSNQRFSLLKLQPQTGRTHQLRIHLAHIGAPILGDPVYNPRSPKADRMYLHAASLEITIPGEQNGQRLTFTAPLPEEFRRAVE